MTTQNTESLERLHAVLEAQSLDRWWPVLNRLLMDSAGWYRQHAGHDDPDPAIDELVELIESKGVDLDDVGLAQALSRLEFVRRRAAAEVRDLDLKWSTWSGAFAEFEQIAGGTQIRTWHDVLTQEKVLAYTMLGAVVFSDTQSSPD